MQYRPLGTTGLQVSILGFGAMRLPTLGTPDQIDEPAATRILHTALDAGVNYLDTAWYYHPKINGQRGNSEPFLGRALAGHRRDQVLLATKLPQSLIHSRQDMDTFLEDQLQQLRTDHLDFYLLHGINAADWSRLRDLGVREFLNSAKQRGLIRFPAFSFHGPYDDLPPIITDYPHWAFAQLQYNYVDTHWQAGAAGLRLAAEKNLGIVIMEPLKGGYLANLAPPVLQLLFSYRKEPWTPAQWALRFLWNDPAITCVLSGMSTPDQLAENLRLADTVQPNTLTPDQLAVLESAREALWATLRAPCTHCNYCQPCPQGVEIPHILTSYNTAAIWHSTNDWLTGYCLIQGTPNLCTNCGTCEPRCPQILPIRQLLNEAAACFQK